MEIGSENRLIGRSYAFFIVLFFFVGLTTIYMNFYKPYEIVGDELLKNSQFENRFEGWRASDSKSVEKDLPGTVALYAMEPGKNIFLYQRVWDFSDAQYLLLSGRAETEAVTRGNESWERAKLVAVFHGENNKKILANVIQLPWGSNEWKDYELLFEVKPGTESIRVGPNIAMVTGIMRVQGISLKPVVIKAEAAYLRVIGLISWGIMIMWLMWGYLKYLGQQHVVTLFFVGLLIAGMAMPGSIRDSLASRLPDIHYEVGHLFIINIDTASHFLLFFGAAYLLVKTFTERRWWVITIDLILLGIATEFLQVFIEGRTAEPIDLIVNYSGLFIGVGLAVLGMKKVS